MNDVAPGKITDQIKNIALDALRAEQDGLRYTDLIKKIQDARPDFKYNTIAGSIWNLDAVYPDSVYKPSRGVFRLLQFKSEEVGDSAEIKAPETSVKTSRETDFYIPFANWLKNEIEDVTHAIPLGYSKFRDKWGTPDVIGKNESRRSDIVTGITEIVSAEIKTEPTQLITAFGQSCAYKLFSHKVYLVIPDAAAKEDISRLDSLCQIFGIGLVTFSAYSTENPDFRIRVRPSKHEPDLFYTNKYMRLVESEMFP